MISQGFFPKGGGILLFWFALITTLDPINGDFIDTLYHEHHRLLYGVVFEMVNCHEDAEDILQHTFVDVWRNAKRFQTLDRDQTIALLVKYAKNRAIDFLRKKKRCIQTIPSLFEDDESETKKERDIPDYSQNPETIILEKTHLQKLASYVELLSDEQREVLELKYGNGMSNIEIAEVLLISVDSVNSRIYRAKQTLNKMKKGDEE